MRIKVDAQGRAVVYYTVAGRRYHPLVWGAVNARPPSRSVRQVSFKVDYSGGWGSFRKNLWKTMKNGCRPYDGPRLAWLVAACKAPDGSHWALQSWQRTLPNLGLTPWRRAQLARELHISHWRGELPKLEIHLDWVYPQRFHHLFGRFTYRGRPVHGFVNTPSGAPLDTYGRNIYVDTLNSAYGSGWKRENSFLANRPRGNFCYGFFPRPSYYDKTRRPAAHGKRYRATAIGPGVTPDPFWTAEGLGEFDPAYEAQMNALGDEIAGDSSTCRQH